jgi:uncharacterized protein (DUF1697 family)
MRNDKLRGVFERLGFENVKTVISSGNVIFESPSRSIRKLEESIEKALPEELGFKSTTIIRSQGQGIVNRSFCQAEAAACIRSSVRKLLT